MKNQRARFLFMSFWVLGLFTGCVPAFPAEAPLAASATPAPTTTAEVLVDCFQSATAVAWLDENGNGLRDDGEPPLPDIEFVLEPTVYSRTTSDENGVADIFATTPGGDCLENLQVIAVKFDGYTLTTPQTLDYVEADIEYAFGFWPAPLSDLIETDSYTGAIFPAEATTEFITWLYAPVDATWTPIAEDMAALEDGLADFLQASELDELVDRLPEYTRQYFGFMQADEQHIYANFFCDVSGVDWQETAVVVDDGGDCYFQVIYSAAANTFISISVNGES